MLRCNWLRQIPVWLLRRRNSVSAAADRIVPWRVLATGVFPLTRLLFPLGTFELVAVLQLRMRLARAASGSKVTSRGVWSRDPDGGGITHLEDTIHDFRCQIS